MIEVHVFNAFLLPSLQKTSWFHLLNFINGLVAPAFLFVSGFAFVLSTQNKVEELRKFKSYFWKKLSRVVLVLLVGYSLHLPYLSFHKTFTWSSKEVLLSFYNVDILQCIAAGLFIILLLRILFKNNKLFIWFLTGLTAAVAAASPFIWKIDFSEFLILPLANYLNPMHGSFFPLFPWLGFLLAGAVTSYYFLNAYKNNSEKKFIILFFFFGIILTFLAIFFQSDIFHGSINLINPNPFFFIERLGLTGILLSLCWFYSDWEKSKSKYITLVGKESLLVYWLHLQIIYRYFWGGNSFESLAGKSLDALEAISITILLIFLMIIAARYWNDFKVKNKPAAKKLTAGVVAIILILFFIL